MTMTEWARNEVEIACKRENPNRKDEYKNLLLLCEDCHRLLHSNKETDNINIIKYTLTIWTIFILVHGIIDYNEQLDIVLSNIDKILNLEEKDSNDKT